LSDDQGGPAATNDPEKVHILVTGNCGHTFPIPLARIEDGADFACPSCGELDRLDDAALQAARDDLAKLRKKGPLDELGTIVSDFLSRSGDGKK
jgi:hypothetical protein